MLHTLFFLYFGYILYSFNNNNYFKSPVCIIGRVDRINVIYGFGHYSKSDFKCSSKGVADPE